MSKASEQAMDIIAGDLSDARVIRLLGVHLSNAQAHSPPESTHALDVGGLNAPDISFWAAWDGERLMGVGALRHLSPAHGEVKSMHTATEARRAGVGTQILVHIIAEARKRGYARLSLETGTKDYFRAARALYARHGFRECAPFHRYVPDPNSVFMMLDLR
jgi:putative acetyltransferase